MYRPRGKALRRGVALATLAAATALATSRGTPDAIEPAPGVTASRLLRVETSVARRQDHYTVTRYFLGRVEASRQAEAGFERAGMLAAVAVDEGDEVERGELIARLDTERLQARRVELEAALAAARAERSLARVTFERQERLVRESHTSRQTLDEARENLRAREAAVRLAEARLQSNRVELKKSHLRAPFDAVVTARLADEGRVLALGEPVLRLQERAPVEVRVGVAGAATESLAVGDRIAVRVGARDIPARVKAILPVRDASRRTVDAILSLDIAPGRVRSGDLAELRVASVVPESGFWVPLGALAEAGRGLWSVYVLEPVAQGPALQRVVPHTVEVLHQTRERVYVRGTLEGGDRFVRGGLHRVVPGQLVRTGALSNEVAAARRGR